MGKRAFGSGVPEKRDPCLIPKNCKLVKYFIFLKFLFVDLFETERERERAHVSMGGREEQREKQDLY